MREYLIAEIMKRTWLFRRARRRQLETMPILQLMAIFHRKCQ